MLKPLFFVLVLFTSLEILGQAPSIAGFPENLQLYVRGANNTCKVHISGSLTSSDTTDKAEVRLYRNDILLAVMTEPKDNFEFDVLLNAELSEYTFRLNKVNKNGKTKIAEADKVLCGDAILLYGQSNMVALSGIDEFNAYYSDKFMRSYNSSTADSSNYVWRKAKTPYGAIGTIGNYLMLILKDSLKVPFLTINSAEGGVQLSYLRERNPTNPFDQRYPYGKMLTRLKKAGVLNQLRFMAFNQGEGEAGNWYLDCNGYPESFDKFINQIKEDIPSLEKFYEFQINILNGHHVERAGYLRDFQRQTQKLYPGFIENISTVGTEPFDGIHFGDTGFIQLANYLANKVLRDIYGRIPKTQIEFPNIEYAYYTPGKDSIILEFQKGQSVDFNLSRDLGNYSRWINDYMYFTNDNETIGYNQYNTNIAYGIGIKNKIKLKLKAPQDFKYITYLPSTFSDNFSTYYNGPHISNSSNLRAFTFYCFPIASGPRPLSSNPQLPENLRANGVTTHQINIVWRDISTAPDVFYLEASVDSTTYTNIYTGSSTSFSYENLPSNKKYNFRIKSCNSTGCTPYSAVSSATTFQTPSYGIKDSEVKSHSTN